MASRSGWRLVRTWLASAGWKDDADDEAVEGERLGENEDEDHAHEQLGLLRVCPAEDIKQVYFIFVAMQIIAHVWKAEMASRRPAT